ncbi:MAG: matrixin family metalloprotease [Gemmataceae bacterium]
MSGELAEAIPPDPSLAGTLAGDIFINSSAKFTSETLFGVALHEIGHALGLASSTDPSSVMFDTFNHNLTLSASDIVSIRSLYGARAADAHEGQTGNGSISASTRIKYSSSFDGSTPLVIFGDITTASDVDVYYLPVPDTYSGPMTLRLQTTGVSLLAPRLTITDAQGAVLASTAGSNTEGEVLSLSVPQVTADGKYYIRVEAAANATFKVGTYGLAATFDRLLQPSELALDSVLRGAYDSLSPQDIVALFKNPSGSTFNDDLNGDNTQGTASLLSTLPGFAANTRFRTTASISTPTDVDFYHVKAPSTQSNAPVVLTAMVRAVAPNGAVQRIELFDSHQTRISSTILANGNGTLTVQAAGLPANTDYYVRVGGGQVGNYQLDIVFGSKAAEVTTFSQGTVPVGRQLSTALYVGQTQVFGFTLSAVGSVGTYVRLAIIDAIGHEVYSLTGSAGDTVSGATGFLAPGEYRLQVVSLGARSPASFVIRGTVFTDPIGPQRQESATAPLFRDPKTPGAYLYPDGTQSMEAFLWGLWSIV